MLKNLTLRYDAEQDRLLLLLVTTLADGSEQTHALHVTRRVCAAWRRDLQKAVDLSAQAPQSLQPALRTAVSKAHHDAQSSQAQVRTEKAAAATVPANLVPRLVTAIRCGRSQADGRWVLRFLISGGAELSLMLNTRTLHGLFDALSRRVQAAEWNLPVLPAERDAPVPPMAGMSPLH